jgi:putative ABC transport system permease protein
MAYSVGQRTLEIGIRLAHGARPGDVLGMVLREGLGLAVLGVGLGLLGAFALTRVMAGLLFGVGPSDPATFALVAALLVAVTAFASLVPAYRATRVDPIVALRAE